MKKLLMLMTMFVVLGAGVQLQAQTKEPQTKEQKTKVKKTSTIPQKVHNTFSKHKKYKGYKVKHKVETKKPA